MSELFSEETKPMDRVAEFVEMFKRVKTEKTGRKSVLKGLNDDDTKKLKALFRRGYNIKEIELAVRAMYDDPEQWAVNKRKDIPTHLLRQFDTYLEAAMHEKKKNEYKAKVEESITQRQEREDEEQRREWIKLAKSEYTSALKRGDWSGSIMDAVWIGEYFKDSFTPQEKAGFFKLAKDKAEDVKDIRIGSTDIAAAVKKELSTPRNLFCEIVVIEAVKRKIPEPWKEAR